LLAPTKRGRRYNIITDDADKTYPLTASSTLAEDVEEVAPC